MIKFYLTISVLPDNFSVLWNLLYRVPMGKCFWCYFRHCLSLSFRECKKDSNILKVFLVQDFCSLKTEIADFLMDFVLGSQEGWEEQCQLVKHFFPSRVRLRAYLFFIFFPVSFSASWLKSCTPCIFVSVIETYYWKNIFLKYGISWNNMYKTPGRKEE